MSWETIENLKPEKASATIPAHGIYVTSRALKLRRKGVDRGETRFIKLVLGAELARKLVLNGNEVGVRLLFGSAENSGKIKISVDATSGNFIARGNAKGAYTITLNKASEEGLFSLDFPSFSVTQVEALRPENGQPPHCIVRDEIAQDEMRRIEQERRGARSTMVPGYSPQPGTIFMGCDTGEGTDAACFVLIDGGGRQTVLDFDLARLAELAALDRGVGA